MSISGRYYEDFKRMLLKYYKDILDYGGKDTRMPWVDMTSHCHCCVGHLITIGGKAHALPFGWWGISLLLVGRAPHCHLVGRASQWHIMLLECYKDGIRIIYEHIIRIP